jgi:hypothetical protein
VVARPRVPEVRKGGAFAIAAGVQYTSLGIVLLVDPRTSTWHNADYAAYALFAGASLAASATLLGLRRTQSHLLGRTGNAGFVVAWVGLGGLIVVAVDRIQAGGEPADALLLLGFVLAAVGYLTIGWTTWRARALPMWAAFLPAIGIVGAAVLQDAHGAGVWQGIVWIGLGVTLRR